MGCFIYSDYFILLEMPSAYMQGYIESCYEATSLMQQVNSDVASWNFIKEHFTEFLIKITCHFEIL